MISGEGHTDPRCRYYDDKDAVVYEIIWQPDIWAVGDGAGFRCADS